VEIELPDNVNWLIRLRWLAGLGVLIVSLTLTSYFKIAAPTKHLFLVGVFILLCNLAFHLINRRLAKSDSQSDIYQSFMIGQIVVDWIGTILVIHYSGGIESPVIFFFFFHLVIASILFQPRVAIMLSVFAMALIFSLAGLEYSAILPHYNLAGFLDFPLYQNRLYVAGTLLFFGFTAAFITYLVTNISRHLNQRVEQVVDLSENLQQATNQLQALNSSARTLSSTLELSKVLNLLVQNTAEVMNIKACSIRLLDKSGKRLDPLVVYGLSESYLNKGPVMLESSPMDRKVLEGMTLNIPDVAQSSLLQYPEWALQEGFYSMLSAPIFGKTKPLGILRAYSEEKNYFNQNDERFLTAIAAQGGIAIENAIAYQAIEEMEATKSTFVRTFTHELRSPVGVIYGLLRNLMDGYAGKFTPLQHDLLERAIKRTDFVRELIDDLLDLSAGKLQDQSKEVMETLCLAEILQGVAKHFEISAQEKGVTLNCEVNADDNNIFVLSTSVGLDRIFNNLVSNAVKYTPAGGSINIRLSKDDKETCVTIEDSGIGIPEDAIPQLFNEFYRAPNAKSVESKGTGLGLAIVKDTVARFGGQVSVQSKEGVGTCFTVILPKAENKADKEKRLE
jgi:signal transduction histidine kinase